MIKLYQIINDDENDKLFLVMQLADMGQLMKWDEETLKYQTNTIIYDFIKKKIGIENLESFAEKEAISKYIFREIGEGVKYLHKTKQISHRDIKLDNVVCKSDGLFRSTFFWGIYLLQCNYEQKFWRGGGGVSLYLLQCNYEKKFWRCHFIYYFYFLLDENCIKLCDFTTSKKFIEGQKFFDIAGTAGFRGFSKKENFYIFFFKLLN